MLTLFYFSFMPCEPVSSLSCPYIIPDMLFCKIPFPGKRPNQRQDIIPLAECGYRWVSVDRIPMNFFFVIIFFAPPLEFPWIFVCFWVMGRVCHVRHPFWRNFVILEHKIPVLNA